jgi:hypothetical protein
VTDSEEGSGPGHGQPPRAAANAPEVLFEQMERQLRGGLELEGAILEAAGRIREASKAAYSDELRDARLALMSLLAASIELHAGTPASTDADRSASLALVAALVQGAGATEGLISEGQYIKAAAALKQDLEVLARLGEIRAGAARRGVTPNIKYAPTGAGRWYGELNNVAHPSNPELIDLLLQRRPVGHQAGVSVVPVFNREIAVGLYEVHVWTLLMLTREQLVLMGSMYGESGELAELARQWVAIGEMLKRGGHVSEVP